MYHQLDERIPHSEVCYWSYILLHDTVYLLIHILRICDQPVYQRSSFGFAHKVYIYPDLSILACDYLSYGTLQVTCMLGNIIMYVLLAFFIIYAHLKCILRLYLTRLYE